MATTYVTVLRVSRGFQIEDGLMDRLQNNSDDLNLKSVSFSSGSSKNLVK
jgi:hypothetical protein